MMVIPPQLGLYMTLAPEEKTLYSVGGPKAQAEFDAGLQGFATRAFRGLGVVMSEPVRASSLHTPLANKESDHVALHPRARSLRSPTTPTPSRCSRARARLASSTSWDPPTTARRMARRDSWT